MEASVGAGSEVDASGVEEKDQRTSMNALDRRLTSVVLGSSGFLENGVQNPDLDSIFTNQIVSATFEAIESEGVCPPAHGAAAHSENGCGEMSAVESDDIESSLSPTSTATSCQESTEPSASSSNQAIERQELFSDRNLEVQDTASHHGSVQPDHGVESKAADDAVSADDKISSACQQVHVRTDALQARRASAEPKYRACNASVPASGTGEHCEAATNLSGVEAQPSAKPVVKPQVGSLEGSQPEDRPEVLACPISSSAETSEADRLVDVEPDLASLSLRNQGNTEDSGKVDKDFMLQKLRSADATSPVITAVRPAVAGGGLTSPNGLDLLKRKTHHRRSARSTAGSLGSERGSESGKGVAGGRADESLATLGGEQEVRGAAHTSASLAAARNTASGAAVSVHEQEEDMEDAADARSGNEAEAADPITLLRAPPFRPLRMMRAHELSVVLEDSDPLLPHHLHCHEHQELLREIAHLRVQMGRAEKRTLRYRQANQDLQSRLDALGEEKWTELEDQVEERERMVAQLQQELKAARRIQKEQEKALKQEAEQDLAVQLQQMAEELRVQREAQRRLKKKHRTDEEFLKRKDKEIAGLQDKCGRLVEIVRGREPVDAKVRNLISEKEQQIQLLSKRLEMLTHAKESDTRTHLRAMRECTLETSRERERNAKLQEELQEKDKELRLASAKIRECLRFEKSLNPCQYGGMLRGGSGRLRSTCLPALPQPPHLPAETPLRRSSATGALEGVKALRRPTGGMWNQEVFPAVAQDSRTAKSLQNGVVRRKSTVLTLPPLALGTAKLSGANETAADVDSRKAAKPLTGRLSERGGAGKANASASSCTGTVKEEPETSDESVTSNPVVGPVRKSKRGSLDTQQERRLLGRGGDGSGVSRCVVKRPEWRSSPRLCGKEEVAGYDSEDSVESEEGGKGEEMREAKKLVEERRGGGRELGRMRKVGGTVVDVGGQARVRRAKDDEREGAGKRGADLDDVFVASVDKDEGLSEVDSSGEPVVDARGSLLRAERKRLGGSKDAGSASRRRHSLTDVLLARKEEKESEQRRWSSAGKEEKAVTEVMILWKEHKRGVTAAGARGDEKAEPEEGLALAAAGGGAAAECSEVSQTQSSCDSLLSGGGGRLEGKRGVGRKLLGDLRKQETSTALDTEHSARRGALKCGKDAGLVNGVVGRGKVLPRLLKMSIDKKRGKMGG